MRDAVARSLLKRLVALLWRVDLQLRPGIARLFRKPRWELAGACNSCGACCVEPSIHVGFFTWRLPTLRRLFVAWQRRVNGFELAALDRRSRTLVFRCTHYDPARHRCDSYASRPAMCRDYPRALLQDAWPEFFEGCGHRARSTNLGLRAQIDGTALSEDEKAALKKKLRLD